MVQTCDKFSTDLKNKQETIVFLEDEDRIKSNEISSLSMQVSKTRYQKQLQDETTLLKQRIFKDNQKIKTLKQIIIKDLKAKLVIKVG